MNQPTDKEKKQLQAKMSALAHQIAALCSGQTQLVVRGAIGFLLGRVIMDISGNNLNEALGQVDTMAAAMKDDIRKEYAKRRH